MRLYLEGSEEYFKLEHLTLQRRGSNASPNWQLLDCQHWEILSQDDGNLWLKINDGFLHFFNGWIDVTYPQSFDRTRKDLLVKVWSYNKLVCTLQILC
jgi:hypothetical protein